MRLVSVTSYQDPQITGYDIRDARESMDDRLRLSQYYQYVTFGFFSLNGKLLPLDPRIGSFSLQRHTTQQTASDGFIFRDLVDIPLMPFT